MKDQYKIVGFQVFKASDLEPHPDVQLPMDDEDQVSLAESLDEKGILQPLIVSAKKEGKKHQIYEGVNRWKSRGNAADLPCILVECSNPRGLALTFLGVGRKRSTGQRIMAFLEMHRKEVLKVAEIIGDGLIQNRGKGIAGHVTGGELKGNLVNFTAEAIAAKLHVSDKDVRLGIELLQCIEAKRTASWDRGGIHVAGKPLDMEKDDGKDYLKALKKVHLGLLAGSTPIRRWKPAVGGLAKTEDRQRPPTNHGVIACNAIRSLINAVKHWDDIPAGLKQRIATDWEELREAAAKVHLD